ncbi:hypothetical protein JXB28_03095, partial [Candidatus Woesearchaeota archaeon]|nr:hypothetical protein [Candidatus Woesearchaeota archaeon]
MKKYLFALMLILFILFLEGCYTSPKVEQKDNSLYMGENKIIGFSHGQGDHGYNWYLAHLDDGSAIYFAKGRSLICHSHQIQYDKTYFDKFHKSVVDDVLIKNEESTAPCYANFH